MSKYTPKWIIRGLVHGPRGWLVLLLVVSLVGTLGSVASPEPGEQWCWPDELVSRWGRLGASRIGRRAWRVYASLVDSSVGLGCRLGLTGWLVAVSRPAGGWLWLSLPVLDWGVRGLCGAWPELLRARWYREVAADLPHVYRWGIVGLMALTVSQGVGMEVCGLSVGSGVVCQRDGRRAELRCEEDEHGQPKYRVHLRV